MALGAAGVWTSAAFISLDSVSLPGEDSIDIGDLSACFSICGAVGRFVGVDVLFATSVACGLTAVALITGLLAECVIVTGGSVGDGAVGNLAKRLITVVGGMGVSRVNPLPRVKTKLQANPLMTKRITSNG